MGHKLSNLDRHTVQKLVKLKFRGPNTPIHLLDFLEAHGWLRNPDSQTDTNTKPTSRTLPGNPIMEKILEAGNISSEGAMATLALAFELHTASILQAAILGIAMDDAELDAIRADIRSRLGLEES